MCKSIVHACATPCLIGSEVFPIMSQMIAEELSHVAILVSDL